jgi:hypothetical protein
MIKYIECLGRLRKTMKCAAAKMVTDCGICRHTDRRTSHHALLQTALRAGPRLYKYIARRHLLSFSSRIFFCLKITMKYDSEVMKREACISGINNARALVRFCFLHSICKLITIEFI